MKQLVKSWIAAKKQGGDSLGEALRNLNAECGTYASTSRLSEWRRGKYTPTPKIVSQMLFDTLPWAIKKAGIGVTQAQQDALDDLLWNFTVTDGNRQIKFT